MLEPEDEVVGVRRCYRTPSGFVLMIVSTILLPRPGIKIDPRQDPSLTGNAGLLLFGELVRATNLVERLDLAIDGVRPFKQRRRGLSGGQAMVALAETIAAGASHLAHLDLVRNDAAGAELRAVASTPAPTTAGQLLRRYTIWQCRAVVRELAAAGNQLDRTLGLPLAAPVTLDMDSTLSDVYGDKDGLDAFNYEGRKGIRTQLVSWSERRRILASDLRRGSASEMPPAPALLRRALQTLPEGHGPVSARGDTGFFSLQILETCRRHDVGFAISVPRRPDIMNLRYQLKMKDWRPALDMRNTEIAELPYTPAGWRQEPLRLIIRRVRIPADELSQNPRSRRRRTVPKDQLELLAAGRCEYVYGYSFLVTDLLGDAAEIEHWHRQRARVEERIKDAKSGAALRHLPMHDQHANWAWMTACVVAHNLTSLLSAVTASVNHQHLMETVATATSEQELRRPAPQRVQPHNLELVRRWLIGVPGRLVRGGRQVFLLLAAAMPWRTAFEATFQRLRLLTDGG
jgi:hypothetical protein